MSRRRVVPGDHRPIVLKQHHARFSNIDHWLNRQGHSRLELRSRSGSSVVRNLRFLVEIPADPVTDELSHDTESVLLDGVLNGGADHAEATAFSRLFDADIEGVFRNLQ